MDWAEIRHPRHCFTCLSCCAGCCCTNISYISEYFCAARREQPSTRYQICHLQSELHSNGRWASSKTTKTHHSCLRHIFDWPLISNDKALTRECSYLCVELASFSFSSSGELRECAEITQWKHASMHLLCTGEPQIDPNTLLHEHRQ